MNDKIAKLPKWAQHEIKSLQYQLKENKRYYDEKIKQVESGDTNVFISEGVEETPLPKDSQIKFIMGDNQNEALNYITVRHKKEDILLVRVGGNAVIQPQSCNTFQILYQRFKL